MGAQGTADLDFGVFPGKSHATIAVTGQTGIVAGSLAEAWIRPAATADHTSDEHIVDAPMICVADIVAGTGFTIHGVARDGIPVPDRTKVLLPGITVPNTAVGSPKVGAAAPMPYGVWKIAWVWN